MFLYDSGRVHAPVLPRQRRALKKLHENSNGVRLTEDGMLHKAYYEFLDLTKECIKDRYYQTCMAAQIVIEDQIVHALLQTDISEDLDVIRCKYGDEIDVDGLDSELSMIHPETPATATSDKISKHGQQQATDYIIPQHIQSHEAIAAHACQLFYLQTHIQCFRSCEEFHKSKYEADQVKFIAHPTCSSRFMLQNNRYTGYNH